MAKKGFMSGLGGLALWVILKGMTAKPIESNWVSVIVGFLLGGYLIQANIPCKNSIDGACIFGGCYSILLAVLMLGELTLIPWLEKKEAKRKQREEEEEEARRTAERRACRVQSRAEKRQARATELANALATHQPTYAASPVAAYAPAEESPAAAPAVSTPASAPVAEEEEKKNTLTPLNISTTTKTTESSTKKKTYTRRYI